MKKSIVWTLLFAMLLSACLVSAQAMKVEALSGEDFGVIFDEYFEISKAGANVAGGPNSGHGNHQTRIVHTTHGDYACYITDSSTSSTSTTLDELSIIKINDDNTTEVVEKFYKAYDSSQSCVIVDNDENVWAVVTANNSLKDQFDGRTSGWYLAAYRVDAETDEVTSYSVILPVNAKGAGISYGSFVFDPSTNQIYAFIFDGQEVGADKDTIYWTIFDVATKTWEGKVHSISCDYRHGYPYMIPDGKGGLMLICERDYAATAGGYAEISDNLDGNYQPIDIPNRWSAGYFWDQLDLFYITDMDADDYKKSTPAPTDWSKVTGDEMYRRSLEGRQNNMYPNVQCNNGGDVYFDGTYLHLIYSKEFLYAASTRRAGEKDWIHVVVDPATMTNVYEETLIDDVADGAANSYRICKSVSGEIFFVRTRAPYAGDQTALMPGKIVSTDASKNVTMTVYHVAGNPTDGYEYTEVAAMGDVAGDYIGSTVINLASVRGNCLQDDTFGYIFQDGNDWFYGNFELHTHNWEDDYTIDVPVDSYNAGQKSIHCKDCDCVKDVTVLEPLLPQPRLTLRLMLLLRVKLQLLAA